MPYVPDTIGRALNIDFTSDADSLAYSINSQLTLSCVYVAPNKTESGTGERTIVQGLERRELIAVLLDQIREFREELPTITAVDFEPPGGVVRLLGGLDGYVDILRPSSGDGGEVCIPELFRGCGFGNREDCKLTFAGRGVDDTE